MLSFSQMPFYDSLERFLKISVWVTLSLILSACTIAPVYSTPEQQDTRFELQFASPASRLEQIVYSELAAAFPGSSPVKNYLVEIGVASSDVSPAINNVALTGTITLTDLQSGKIIYSGTRTASASLESSPQNLASQQAANEASERAARDLAQSIRLSLIGILSAQSR